MFKFKASADGKFICGYPVDIISLFGSKKKRDVDIYFKLLSHRNKHLKENIFNKSSSLPSQSTRAGGMGRKD